MNRQEYGNPLGNQVKSLPELVDEQVKRCFDEKKIQELISVAEIFDVRKIYITGAGDSIAAAGAFAEVIQKFAGVFHCEAIDDSFRYRNWGTEQSACDCHQRRRRNGQSEGSNSEDK